MAKKSQKKTRSVWSAEMKNILAGLGILFLCVLVFFGPKDSKVGEILFDGLEALYGEYYKAIFSGYVLLALGIIVGKLHWNSVRII